MNELSSKFSVDDKKKAFWTLSYILFLCLIFWFSSRYPALDSKAIMEGSTNFQGIGFEHVFSFSEDAPAYEKIALNTLNWIETNRNGMTFGVLFAAALMLLFSLLENLKFKHPFLNSIMGMLIGFPLGVCVNCAAPIAQGVYKGGGKAETALSMMISSPTLNIVVLTMTFSIFPLYMAILKVLLSIVVILIAVPLIARVFLAKKTTVVTDEIEQQLADKAISPFEVEYKESLPTNNIADAFVWFLKAYWKRLWYIIKKTVPLMFLAGLIGNIFIHYLPWEILGGIGNFNPLGTNLLIMLAIAVVGVLLPVPMAFDIIVVSVLMAAGLPPLFAMVLLFTLGSFSIYSFFIVWQTFRLKLALSLAFVIILLSVGGGLVAHKYGKMKGREDAELYRTALSSSNPKAPTQLYFPSNSELRSHKSISNSIKDIIRTPAEFKSFPHEQVTIEYLPFNKNETKDEKKGIIFKRRTGKEVGLSVDLSFDIKNEFSQISQSSCISAGDIQNNGWQDVIITSMNGVYLFINTGMGGYSRQSFEIPELKNHLILTTVLVDLNNDGWLDLFIGTYKKGNFILLNQSGDLTSGNLISLESDSKTIFTLAPAFADVDRNSTLDIYSGNWSVGMMGNRSRGFKSSVNYLITNPLGSSRKETKLTGPAGETLTTLFTDFNNDGIQDLIVGNDFNMPELFYQGQEDGQFKLITKDDGLVPLTTRNCMSIDGIDINNDLVNEYFLAGSSSKDLPAGLFKAADAGICEELVNEEERKQCEQIMQLHEEITLFRKTKEIKYAPENFKEDCIAFDLLSETVGFLEKSSMKRSHLCDFMPSNEAWSFIRTICEFDRQDTVIYSLEDQSKSIPDVRNLNVLLQKKSENTFVDASEIFNLGVTGWTWNAKFADFDNDQFPDVFITNGSFHEFKREPNFLLKNNAGKEFIDVSEEANMNSYLPSYTSVYTDFDNDGDLDIIMPPALAPIQFYENITTGNNSIVVELNDSKGNKQGIGSKVTISYGESGQKQIREIKASGGYRSFNAVEAWFGLGIFETIHEITVEWSTGEKQVLEGPFPVGNRYIVQRN